MATKKAVAKKEEAGALATFEEWEGDTGFEDTTSDDYALPFFKLLQKGSPEVDEDNAAFVEGAKAGMYFNTATQELYESLLFVVCHYTRAMVEWKNIDDGGGFVAQHEVGYEKQFEQDERGRWVTQDGDAYLADTRYFFGLAINEETGALSPGVLSFTSTQLKKARTWMSNMEKMKTKSGKQLPVFANKWRLTSVGESNADFNWKGYKVELAGSIEQALLDPAIAARKMFSTASTSVKPPTEGGEGSTEAPF